MKRLCVMLLVLVLLGTYLLIKKTDIKEDARMSGNLVLYKFPVKQEDKQKPDEKQKEPDQDIVSVPVPSTVQLSVSQKVQETSYYCACACVQMTLELFGTSLSQSELAAQMHTDPVTGSEYADTVRVLNRYLFGKEDPLAGEAGYRVQRIHAQEAFASVFEQRLVRNLQDGYPIFATVDLHALYPQLPSANHMVLVIGYVMKGNTITHYLYIDPYPPVQDAKQQGLKTVSKEIFLHAMALNEEPAYLW